MKLVTGSGFNLIAFSLESDPGSGDLELAELTFRFFSLLFGVARFEPVSFIHSAAKSKCQIITYLAKQGAKKNMFELLLIPDARAEA